MTRKPAFAERVPLFELPTPEKANFRFDTVAGRPIILAFLGTSPTKAVDGLVEEAKSLLGFFDAVSACLFWVASRPDGVAAQARDLQAPGIRFFMDYERVVASDYGLTPDEWSGASAEVPVKPCLFVVDRNLRLLQRIDVTEPRAYLAPILASLRRVRATQEEHGGLDHAPVLIIERLFEKEVCRLLIEYYQRHGGEDSGFMKEREGRTVLEFDHAFKRRRDCLIEDPALRTGIVNRLHDRLAPEVQRAFQFNPTRLERHLVARYDAQEGGYFRAHRDNTTKGTAHRRFAVSVNLNAEEYDGGDLRFPEFGWRTYRPPTGGAVVFSCSLLHEATEVTRGSRYAYLPFLYGDEDAALRRRNEHLVEL